MRDIEPVRSRQISSLYLDGQRGAEAGVVYVDFNIMSKGCRHGVKHEPKYAAIISILSGLSRTASV